MDKGKFCRYMEVFLEENSKLNLISKNDENPIVRIHSEGAVRITEKTIKKIKRGNRY